MKIKFIFTFAYLILLIKISFAQTDIPNGNFDLWTTNGNYENPDFWKTLNEFTDTFNIYTCTKGLAGIAGNPYIRLTSKSISGIDTKVGIAVCGKLNIQTLLPESGFPFTARPQSFNGQCQHMIFGNSQGYIEIQLTKWNSISNSRDLIASAHNTLVDMAMGWESFSFDLNYQSQATPDSCIIVLSASGSNPTDGDYLWIDELFFSGNESFSRIVTDYCLVEIYPNPFNDELNIQFDQNTSAEIYFTNALGENIFNSKLINQKIFCLLLGHCH